MANNINLYFPQKLKGIVDMIHETEITTPNHFKLMPFGGIEIIFILDWDELSRLGIEGNPNGDDFNPNSHFATLFGSYTKPYGVKLKKGHAFGVVMNPIAARAVFNIPASELKDVFIEPTMINSNLNEIQDKLNTLPTFIAKAKFLENYILNRIESSPEMNTALGLSKHISILSKENVTFEESSNRRYNETRQLDNFAGYSKAHAHRLYQDWFGQTSNQYSRFFQFREAMWQIIQTKDSLTKISYENGYYDQAHFIRNFKSYSGITPNQFRKAKKAHLPFILSML